jgi:hypothetical protein
MRVDFKQFLMAEDEVRLLESKVNIPDLKKGQPGEIKEERDIHETVDYAVNSGSGRSFWLSK